MPNVAFLGLCDRASYTRQGPFVVQNILGLRSHVLSFIFPLDLAGLKFVFGLYDPTNIRPEEIRFVAPDGTVAFTLNITLQASEGGTGEEPPPNSAGPFTVPSREPFWMAATAAISPPAVIPKPGLYRLVLSGGEQIGFLHLHLVEPPPLTADRAAAIRADPRGSKLIVAHYACTQCADSLSTYAALDRDAEREKGGTIWYSELPENFVCKCGRGNVDLTVMRRNLHGLLGAPTGELRNLSITPLYEKSTLDTVYQEFAELVRKDCAEEEIQQYIAEHPVLLAPFHPQRVFFKSPILSKFKTDITVLTQTGVLTLIELERSDKKVLTKSGDTTAHLQHALRQVRDWLHEFDDHRQAALDCIRVEGSEVVSIETVVIMGRDSGHDPKRLKRLKGDDHGRRVKVWTYDDLLRAFEAVIRSIGNA